MFKVSLAVVVVALCALIGVAHGQTQTDFRPDSKRQQVISQYERRKKHLQELHEKASQKVEHHERGLVLLKDEEYESFKKQAKLYKEKLESIGERISESDIDRALKRSEVRSQKYRDSIKVDL